MATTLIAGAVLSASFTVLIEKLASRQFIDFFGHRKLDDRLVGKLRNKLMFAEQLLFDAEEKQITDPKVRLWLDDLKHAFYQAQDFLDELRAEMEAASQTSTSPLLDIIFSLDPRQNKGEEMESKLEELLQTFEVILEGKEALGLTAVNQARTQTFSDRQTTSLVDDSSVFGRNADKEAIVKLLLSDDASSTCPGVVSTVGMGGIGKTTLAQLAFNDSRVQGRFKLKAWVCVSEELDFLKLTKNILKEIGSSNCDSMTSNQLQNELEDKVRGERILLVLDDVWKNIFWDNLLQPLKSAAQGSKVLVTTREESVVSKVTTIPIYKLKELSEDDCWSLFAKHAFDCHDSDADADLKEVGRKIVRKCKGQPLAAKTIGSLLRGQSDVGEWEKIVESNIWDLKDDKIIPALRLSYHYLPCDLKQCFSYCAIFPKDFEFTKEKLIFLWMAAGFIVQRNNDKREMEEIGEEYFQGLLSRSFFQKYELHEGNFVMHDLINDLAKSIEGEFCYNNVEASSGQLTERTRHLYYEAGSERNASEELESLCKAKDLRTLLFSIGKAEYRHVVNFLQRFRCLRALHIHGDGDSLKGGIDVSLLVSSSSAKHLRYMKLSELRVRNLSGTLPYLQTLIVEGCGNLTSLPDSIGDMKDLRHLSLRFSGIESLPDSIGKLKDLRHLDLGYTKIIRLPGSICGLYNLQHLSLEDCPQLVELPAKMMDLINLCYLDISGDKHKPIPLSLGKFVKLQHLILTLPAFFVDKDGGSRLAELGPFRNLRGRFCLRNLQNVGDVQDALEAKIKNKSLLEELVYEWKGDTLDGSVDRSLLQHLEPHVNVKVIDIRGYRGENFPNWVGRSSFTNIVRLDLLNCKYCTCLPPLGQLGSLQYLSIEGFDSIVSVGAELYGDSKSSQPFRSLITLEFKRMPWWKEWTFTECEREDDDCTIFPLLQDLTITQCPELERPLIEGILPSTIQKLRILGCNKIISGRVHWDLHKLSSLSHFAFGSAEDIQSFPGMISLPSTLIFISIWNLQNLKSLDYTWLRQLTSLKRLEIAHCPNLESIPEEGLPSSLDYFIIDNCPLLDKRCQEERGKDWFKILRFGRKSTKR